MFFINRIDFSAQSNGFTAIRKASAGNFRTVCLKPYAVTRYRCNYFTRQSLFYCRYLLYNIKVVLAIFHAGFTAACHSSTLASLILTPFSFRVARASSSFSVPGIIPFAAMEAAFSTMFLSSSDSLFHVISLTRMGHGVYE